MQGASIITTKVVTHGRLVQDLGWGNLLAKEKEGFLKKEVEVGSVVEDLQEVRVVETLALSSSSSMSFLHSSVS